MCLDKPLRYYSHLRKWRNALPHGDKQSQPPKDTKAAGTSLKDKQALRNHSLEAAIGGLTCSILLCVFKF